MQEWIRLLGLPPDDTAVVQKALATDNAEGADLEEMTQRQWFKVLKRSGADNATELAEQAVALHEAAVGEAPTPGKLMAAQADLAQARENLRENRAKMRSQVVHLVSLASKHFPELLSHADVKLFMGSDGLQLSDRKLFDYDDRQTIAIGRVEVIHAKYEGTDVVLKKFLVQGDMRGYMKEIVNVQRLQHRHIIKYSAVFEDAGSMYIEMEYCKHGSLIHWVQSTNPDASQKQSVLRQVLLALACMHDQKIVHCDIKGDNVLIAEDGSARVCDFDMSKDLGTVSASTMAGGTLGFIAPEVKDKKQKHSAASDMYSFGVLVLNMLNPPAPADYPLTDASVVADLQLRTWVALLMHDDPARRPTALQLQAQPYFDVDKVMEKRVHEAEAAAAQCVAQAQSQMVKAKTVEAKAKDAAATAASKQREAALAVTEAQQARQDNAQQAAEARAQINRAHEAQRQANAEAASAVSRQLEADAQLTAAVEAQDGAARQERQAAREKAALLAPLRATTQALARGCDAWVAIETRVQESLPRHVVTLLKQIDNNELLLDFDRQKEIAAARPVNRARGGSVEERANVRYGFHAMGGEPDELKKIYEGGRADGGFDYRLGRQGAYGRGSYFAKHAIYSAYLYPRPNPAADGSVVMLVAEVILGQSKDLGRRTDGNLVREPPIVGGAASDVYDSVQGTEGSFGVHGAPGLHHARGDARRYGGNSLGEEEYGRQYIVYDKAKAYPRYLVAIRPQ